MLESDFASKLVVNSYPRIHGDNIELVLKALKQGFLESKTYPIKRSHEVVSLSILHMSRVFRIFRL